LQPAVKFDLIIHDLLQLRLEDWGGALLVLLGLAYLVGHPLRAILFWLFIVLAKVDASHWPGVSIGVEGG
ncbi:hypothetical protein ACI3PL_27935, partial [Lacticaseibacillus paracasei]